MGSSGESYSQPNYKFQYGVFDSKYNNDFGHEEERNGHTTTGRYSVKLPDGRIQVVNYWADKNGYRAEVTYQTSSGYTPAVAEMNTSGGYGSNSGYSHNNNNHHQPKQSNHNSHQRSSRSSFSTFKTKIDGITYGY